jgi:hypothetical protein
MGAQRHEYVESRSDIADLPMQLLEKKTYGRGPCPVRDNQQDLFALIRIAQAGAGNDIGNLGLAKAFARRGNY